ncbi:MAG: hypothetical protein CM15mP95_0370 [Alphaproteobacteria bacterium]|nr:MAG: hypothetical protein CM15mP95_0370 [Alphaproteobacteria bacterium]
MKDNRKVMNASQLDARMAHDLGGFLDHLLCHGIDVSISQTELPKRPYEERADAILLLLSAAGKGLLNIHAMRRASEQFNHEDYLQLSYYDRWLRAWSLCIEERGFQRRNGLSSGSKWKGGARQFGMGKVIDV